MIPIMLDPALVHVAVCGEGALTVRRVQWLRNCGAEPVIYAPLPSAELWAIGEGKIIDRLPITSDFDGLAAIWIADFGDAVANPLAEAARIAGVLANVEDVLHNCDFHTPAVIHRGRLTIAIGTGGASPAIASILRQRLETSFPMAWAALLDDIATERIELKAQGAAFAELIGAAKAKLAMSGL